jgi:hypothetical protein
VARLYDARGDVYADHGWPLQVLEQYDAVEIGALDADDPGVAGTQSLARYDAVFDRFLEQQTDDKYATRGGARA